MVGRDSLSVKLLDENCTAARIALRGGREAGEQQQPLALGRGTVCVPRSELHLVTWLTVSERFSFLRSVTAKLSLMVF